MMRIIAHQGGAGQWPGNTMTAFEQVLRRPIDGIELDVHLSKDGEPVVLHDPMVETTEGPREVADLTAAELATIDPAQGAAPLLRDVLALIAARSAAIEVMIDVKSDIHARPYAGIIRKLGGLIERMDLVARAVIASFRPETLREAHRLVPAIRLRAGLTALTAEALGDAFAAIACYQAAGATIVDVDRQMLDMVLAQAIRDRGMAVGVATVKDAADLRRWMSMPIDRIITDQPDLALKYRQEMIAGTRAVS